MRTLLTATALMAGLVALRHGYGPLTLIISGCLRVQGFLLWLKSYAFPALRCAWPLYAVCVERAKRRTR